MKQIARISVLLAIIAAGAFLAGCGGTTYERQAVLVAVPLPMTTDQVVAALKDGQGEDTIIAQLQGRGYEGTLTAADVDQLRSVGVPEGVINWMLAHPGAPGMRTAAIVRQGQEVVYVERAPQQVIYVERAPRVTYSFGFGYSWGHHGYYGGSRYYGGPYYRGHYRYHSYPRTRVYHSGGGRTYRYTSGR